MHVSRRTKHAAGIALAAFAALGLASARPVSAQGYTYTTLDDPLASSFVANGVMFTGTYAEGINAAGEIVGYYYNGTGQHGFLYTPSAGFSTLDEPDAVSGSATNPNGSGALGINTAGQIVGGYTDGVGSYGYIYTPGTGFSRISDPSAPQDTFAASINTYGQIVGDYIDGSGVEHGFLDTPGSAGMPSVFSDINNPASTGNTIARGINNNGQITGGYKAGTGEIGFIDSPGTGFADIADPAAPKRTNPFALNDSGQVVGTYLNHMGQFSFVDTPGTGFVTVADPVARFVTFAEGINNSGEIVGYYEDANSGIHGFFAVPAAVPEASSLTSFGLLLLIGGGVLLAPRKRAKVAT